MDYLQYVAIGGLAGIGAIGFKPYYKWITFNIEERKKVKIHIKEF